MSDDNAYAIKSLNRIFKGLPQEQQQEAWLNMSTVMEGYADKQRKKYELVLMAEYTDEARERMKNFGKMQGISTGYDKLDELTKGLVGGEMVIITGRTSYGKTTLALNIANKVATVGIPVLFVTMEMTRPEITTRYMSINSEEDYEKAAALTVFHKDDELDWTSIDGLISGFTRDFSNGLVVIDHLHYFSRETEKTAEDLGRITKEIKKNAMRHNVPVILISHVRKMKKTDEFDNDDLRGSSYIAQDADVILVVQRYADSPEIMNVKITKNRNRGYDFKDDSRELYLDGIKVNNYRQPF